MMHYRIDAVVLDGVLHEFNACGFDGGLLVDFISAVTCQACCAAIELQLV